MSLQEGQRVKLADDLRLSDPIEAAGTVIGILSLAAGTEGTVERVIEHVHETPDVAEYGRLTSLLDSYGDTMPPESKKQLEQKIAELEPAWTAFHEQGSQVTVRVHFDNGFILDASPQHIFVPA
ncbi:hypothetical protein GTY65_39710 [Streptomyces sp. SID8379]|uniref:hypothetical protein n=1 Tax=unclassified Streptomyces TaxID=2593676 RepID=UPI00035E3468|nr:MULTISPECIES: hypothetical protein [unclassified Streptomyces]MYW70137.1 hypothetical protein [Streptomyces sp. SID8379]